MFWMHYKRGPGCFWWGIVLFSRLSLLVQWPPRMTFFSLGSMWWSLHLHVGLFYVGWAHWEKREE